MGPLGPTEIILILLVVILLFGAKKLPDLARGSGRALRIFKAETKGLMDDDKDTAQDGDDDPHTDAHGRPLPPGADVQRPSYQQVSEPEPVVDPSSQHPPR